MLSACREVCAVNPEPRPAEPTQPNAPPPGPDGPPVEPEVDPTADDPVRPRTIGDDPVPTGPDPRLLIDFF